MKSRQQSNPPHSRGGLGGALALAAAFLIAPLAAAHEDAAEPPAESAIVRHALGGGSTFPIARAVETPAHARLIHHSGMVPRPLDADAAPGSHAYWGDTEAQTMSVLTQLQESLAELGLGMGDVVKLTVFLVGDPALDGKMDFAGLMRAYTQFFGTEAQPKLPARSAVQVAGLVRDGMMVEIEAVAATLP